jgi:hypothetical protein
VNGRVTVPPGKLGHKACLLGIDEEHDGEQKYKTIHSAVGDSRVSAALQLLEEIEQAFGAVEGEGARSHRDGCGGAAWRRQRGGAGSRESKVELPWRSGRAEVGSSCGAECEGIRGLRK